jgi:hypothetical protein
MFAAERQSPYQSILYNKEYSHLWLCHLNYERSKDRVCVLPVVRRGMQSRGYSAPRENAS